MFKTKVISQLLIAVRKLAPLLDFNICGQKVDLPRNLIFHFASVTCAAAGSEV